MSSQRNSEGPRGSESPDNALAPANKIEDRKIQSPPQAPYGYYCAMGLQTLLSVRVSGVYYCWAFNVRCCLSYTSCRV